MGRTGRAGKAGTAITLLAPSDTAFAAELERQLAGGSEAQRDEAQQQQPGGGGGGGDEGEGAEEGGEARREPALRPFTGLTRAAVEGLRYRGEDVARSITKNVIKEVGAGGALGGGGRCLTSVHICGWVGGWVGIFGRGG